MSPEQTHRRDFLKRGTLATAAVAAGAATASADKPKPHVATNEYPWRTFHSREGRDFRTDLAASIAEVKKAGFDGFEPLADSPEFIAKLVPLLEDNGLEMQSLYVNSTLHDRPKVRENIDGVLAIAEKARELAGTRIIVTNPSPIRWGGDEDKSDAQLRTQADALNRLGGELRALGMTLAYHNHDAELRQAAREFHHMLTGTDPENVTFCFDTHWVFRGAGDSSVALFDVLTLYGPRVTELHLRQSEGGTWTEAFGPGDIDYPALVNRMAKLNLKPNVVLEQAVEGATPKTMTAPEAHRKGRAVVADMFAPLA